MAAIRTAYYFQVFQGTDRQWYWRFKAPNGKSVAVGGEGYTTKQSAVDGLNVVASHAPGATIVYV